MGVKDLWGILTPICERKPIWELQDKTIAIDLSAWICDSSTVAEHCSQKNMYLRNLFFRTSFLLLLGVKPIFVLEGKAPVLKHDTIERRQIAQGKAAGRNVKAGSRARLKGLQTQCAALLSSMGLMCIQGDGEAEAFCAHLNQAGLVDGVVTQDSDVFLYGGVKVYRNFNTSCAGGGSVDTFEMREIVSRLGLGRRHLIALSLLCGCDYNKGVAGVGKESALKFFQAVPDEEILERIQTWRQNTHLDSIDLKKDKSISPEFKCELQIRAKALQDQDFPCEEVIAEFLQSNQKACPRIEFQWSKPNISQFLKLADVKLAWDSTYALEKALPLLTRWHLTHNDLSLEPERIVNAKTTRGVKCYVVKWEEFDVTTEEPQSLFEQRYPLFVETFVEMKKKGKKKATKNNKENEDVAPNVKSKLSKVKSVEDDINILQEINTQSTTGAIDNEDHIGHPTEIIDNRTNGKGKNKTQLKKNKENKIEPKIKNRKPRSINTKPEESLDKEILFNNNGSKDQSDADIRKYFKNKLIQKLDRIEVENQFDDSMRLLNTSMNSLSLSRPEQIDNSVDIGNNEKLCKKQLDMISITIENTAQIKADLVNDFIDVSMNDAQAKEKFSSIDLDKQKSTENKDDINTIKKHVDNKYETMDLVDDSDIFNYSFNTACQLITKNPVTSETDRNKSGFYFSKESVETRATEHSNESFKDPMNNSETNMSTSSLNISRKLFDDDDGVTTQNSIFENVLSSKKNCSIFHMSVNASDSFNVNNNIPVTDLTNKSLILDELDKTTEFYHSFRTELSNFNTSCIDYVANSEERPSFIENSHSDENKQRSCGDSPDPPYSHEGAWNTSSPLVRCKPIPVSTHQVNLSSNQGICSSQAISNYSFDIDDFECNEIGDLSEIIENIVGHR